MLDKKRAIGEEGDRSPKKRRLLKGTEETPKRNVKEEESKEVKSPTKDANSLGAIIGRKRKQRKGKGKGGS